ncbi:hypothetical protein BT1A1_0547 [Caldibacillus thermoamylovorans]|jgi:hypothetical protein|uniref:Uncharacterized protein n=1 Tax=Caldibacillus thermoamylovorans TaxID=35841 RepID=A0A090IRY4_9BACI|nr:hypothetical protein BT1A1_0547 [Caldibacillus thermoamylovorans]
MSEMMDRKATGYVMVEEGIDYLVIKNSMFPFASL